MKQDFFYEMIVATVAGSNSNTILQMYPADNSTYDQRNSLSVSAKLLVEFTMTILLSV